MRFEVGAVQAKGQRHELRFYSASHERISDVENALLHGLIPSLFVPDDSDPYSLVPRIASP
jgi:hypothetical protein